MKKIWIVLESFAGNTMAHFNRQLWLIGGLDNPSTLHSDIFNSAEGETWTNYQTNALFGGGYVDVAEAAWKLSGKIQTVEEL